MPGKITVRNYTTLTDYAALLRAGMYLAGKKEEKHGLDEPEWILPRWMILQLLKLTPEQRYLSLAM